MLTGETASGWTQLLPRGGKGVWAPGPNTSPPSACAARRRYNDRSRPRADAAARGGRARRRELTIRVSRPGSREQASRSVLSGRRCVRADLGGTCAPASCPRPRSGAQGAALVPAADPSLSGGSGSERVHGGGFWSPTA